MGTITRRSIERWQWKNGKRSEKPQPRFGMSLRDLTEKTYTCPSGFKRRCWLTPTKGWKAERVR